MNESRGPGRTGNAPSGGKRQGQQHARGDAAPTDARPKAVLADARPVARLAMRHAFEREGVAVVGETVDAAGAVRAAQAARPDVCLLDARLPGAIDAVRQIAASAPATCVLVLLETSDDTLLVEALRAGAAGCLYRETGPEALGRAVRATLDGEAPLPRAAARRVIEELRLRASERRIRTVGGTWTRLSQRESQVLELMRQQLTTGEIAEQLGISAVTVRRHVSGTMRRLGVHDRDTAVRLAAGHAIAEQA